MMTREQAARAAEVGKPLEGVEAGEAAATLALVLAMFVMAFSDNPQSIKDGIQAIADDAKEFARKTNKLRKGH